MFLSVSRLRIARFLKGNIPPNFSGVNDDFVWGATLASEKSADELGIKTERGRARWAYVMMMSDGKAAEGAEVRNYIRDGGDTPDNRVKSLIQHTVNALRSGASVSGGCGMSATTEVAGAGGAIAGQWLGRVICGAVGTLIGPEGTVIGACIGGRAGAVAGRAAASAIASYMEGANEDAETKTKDAEQAKPCVDCGDIDCFKPKKGATAKDIEELKRQLDEQQDAINEIPPDDLLHNMESYEEIGRGTADAMSRATARGQWLSDTIETLIEGGMTKSDAKIEAAKRLKTMDVIHTPDLSAGGTGKLSEANGGLASRSINRSIGSQWSKRGAG